MWTTLDGYRLRLPRSGNTLITAQSPGTGRQASLRRPDGSLDCSSVRFIGQVVGGSTRIGVLRASWSNRRYPVFAAEVNGRHYQIITGPSATPGELVILAVRPEVRRFSGEFSDGIGHRRAQNAIYDWLSQQGLQDANVLRRTDPPAFARGEGIRDNLGQLVGVDGAPQRNEPDLSYLAAVGRGGATRRVNVEIDTSVAGSRGHEETLIRNDPDSMHVFLQVHPITGRVIGRRVYDPELHPRLRSAVPQAPSLSLPVPIRPARRRAAPQALPPLAVQPLAERQSLLGGLFPGRRLRPQLRRGIQARSRVTPARQQAATAPPGTAAPRPRRTPPPRNPFQFGSEG